MKEENKAEVWKRGDGWIRVLELVQTHVLHTCSSTPSPNSICNPGVGRTEVGISPLKGRECHWTGHLRHQELLGCTSGALPPLSFLPAFLCFPYVFVCWTVNLQAGICQFVACLAPFFGWLKYFLLYYGQINHVHFLNEWKWTQIGSIHACFHLWGGGGTTDKWEHIFWFWMFQSL